MDDTTGSSVILSVCECGHQEYDHGHSEGDGCLHCPCRGFSK